MADLHTNKWEPITDLSPDWKSKLQDSQTLTMVQTWVEQAHELRQKELYKEFIARLRRQWAVETGIIEGLYDLSEGATIALIEKGLDASLISYEDTNDSPERVFARIQDQHHAILGIYQFISGQRPLGTSYIKELHSVLTAHQETFTARDTLGNLVDRTLPRGAYKSLTNNVEHSDGTVFEYCPPEHVDSEMERLIEMHTRHQSSGVSADVAAAWLHHRFTLVHPFVDGNGRVARCLATLVLLKANWLPLVITRRDRAAYISALRAADNGDLQNLVAFIGDLQRKAIREALSLSEAVLEESTRIDTILAEVRAKFERRRAAEVEKIHRAFRTADSLQILASQRLQEVAREVDATLRDENPHYRAYMFEGKRGSPTSKYHYHQIIQSAKLLEYFANLPLYQAWSALAMITDERTEILFSFHGIGHETAGILGCSAMFYSKETTEEGENITREVMALADSPFEFNYNDDGTDVQRRFSKWLDACVLRGLDQWRQKVV
jgi:Fic family protein